MPKKSNILFGTCAVVGVLFGAGAAVDWFVGYGPLFDPLVAVGVLFEVVAIGGVGIKGAYHLIQKERENDPERQPMLADPEQPTEQAKAAEIEELENAIGIIDDLNAKYIEHTKATGDQDQDQAAVAERSLKSLQLKIPLSQIPAARHKGLLALVQQKLDELKIIYSIPEKQDIINLKQSLTVKITSVSDKIATGNYDKAEMTQNIGEIKSSILTKLPESDRQQFLDWITNEEKKLEPSAAFGSSFLVSPIKRSQPEKTLSFFNSLGAQDQNGNSLAQQAGGGASVTNASLLQPAGGGNASVTDASLLQQAGGGASVTNASLLQSADGGASVTNESTGSSLDFAA